jgi:hypothetical protein
MVHMATMIEKGIKAATANYFTRKRTRSAETSSTPLPKKQATSRHAGSQGRRNTPSQGSSGNPRRNTCGKSHTGVCRMGTVVCFKCGKPGHYAKECTQAGASKGQGSQASVNQPRPTVPARVYAITPENVGKC